MAEKPFEMPPVEVGRIVNWYRDGHRGTTPSPALVTQATPGRIAVAEFPAGVKQHGAYDGVMHIDDPRVKAGHAAGPGGSGAWDYTDWDKRIMAILDQLESPKKEPLKKAS